LVFWLVMCRSQSCKSEEVLISLFELFCVQGTAVEAAILFVLLCL
jgi:hypothetical protein